MNSSTIYTKDLDNISSFSYTSKLTTTYNDATIKSTASTKSYPCIFSINEYRNRQEIGVVKVSIMDLSIVLYQYADPISCKYRKTLALFKDTHYDEIIYPDNLNGFPLISELRKAGLDVKPYDKKHFNFNEGVRIMGNYGVQPTNMVLSLTALAANFHFLINIKKLLVDGLRFTLSSEDDHKNISLNSDCMELLFRPGGLFETINKCRTPQGARLLKTTISNPPTICTNKDILKVRTYIKNMNESPNQKQVESILAFYSDMERVVLYFLFPLRLDKFNCAKQDILNAVNLFRRLAEIETLNLVLGTCGLKLIKEELVKEVDIIKEMITDTMNIPKDFQYKNNMGDLFYVVKEGNNREGILSKSREKLEQIELQIKLTKNVRYSQEHRISLIAARKRIKTEILLLSQLTIRNLRQNLRSVVSGVGMNIVRKISELDFLYSGYLYGEELNSYFKKGPGNVTFPVFTSDDVCPKLKIDRGFHPVMVRNNQDVQPNSFEFDTSCRGFILYGHNSSGKTTYMSQTVLICILALIGYPLPAKNFECSVDIRRIYTKFFNKEDTENKLSSFGQECKDVAEMTKFLNENTLLFIDEYGKSSNFIDGLSLSWALIEKFIRKGCFWTATTHYKELKNIKNQEKNVTIRSFDNQRNYKLGKLNSYNLQAGYGINMAQEVGIDIQIIKKALDMRKKLGK